MSDIAERDERCGARFRVVLVTTRGLADLLAAELRDAFGLDGRVAAAAPDSWVTTGVASLEDLVRLVYRSRLAQRVALELATQEIRQSLDGLDDLEEVTRGAELASLFRPGTSFGVRCQRRGRHAFSSMEAAARVGGAVQDRVGEALGSPPPVDLDDPDLLIRLEILDSRVLLGLDLSAPRSLHRRGYLRKPHRAAVKPTIATGLLTMAGWRPDEPLLDPMCGGGTILIEAAHRAARIPAGHFRRDTFRFDRMPLFDGVDVDGVYAAHDADIDLDRVGELIGADISRPTLDTARVNAGAAGLEGRIAWIRAAIGELAGELAERELPCAVVNPPYGIRMGDDEMVARTYGRLAQTLDRVLTGDGRAVLLSPRSHLVFAVAERRGFHVRRRNLMVGDLKLGAFLLTREPGPGSGRDAEPEGVVP